MPHAAQAAILLSVPECPAWASILSPRILICQPLTLRDAEQLVQHMRNCALQAFLHLLSNPPPLEVQVQFCFSAETLESRVLLVAGSQTASASRSIAQFGKGKWFAKYYMCNGAMSG